MCKTKPRSHFFNATAQLTPSYRPDKRNKIKSFDASKCRVVFLRCGCCCCPHRVKECDAGYMIGIRPHHPTHLQTNVISPIATADHNEWISQELEVFGWIKIHIKISQPSSSRRTAQTFPARQNRVSFARSLNDKLARGKNMFFLSYLAEWKKHRERVSKGNRNKVCGERNTRDGQRIIIIISSRGHRFGKT